MPEFEKELPKAYDAEPVEQPIYDMWEAGHFFEPSDAPETFSIVLPPPNATGVLHTGHAAMLAIEDLMVRYNRLRGKATVWIPGTDHAAIATQNVVEKNIYKEEGKTRHDLGRDELLRRIDTFVEGSKSTIRSQIRRMGSSVDWSRERYTMDETSNRAVRMVFKMMHDDGLIVRGNRVINWCPRCQSTLADDEIEYKEQQTKLYTFTYDAHFPIAISTTRPETKFGDTGVAVHPSDERYKILINKTIEANFADQPLSIRIVADIAADPNFGTGAVGVTPAHSQIDAEIAARHDLPASQVISENATMQNVPEAFSGLSTIEAREKVVAWLRENNLIKAEEDITQNLSVCYRCGTAVEPLPKLQWFVAVNKPFTLHQDTLGKWKAGEQATLKELMRYAVESAQITILPEHMAKTYFHWIDNLRDWCISRQIWFGHQVPVWYKGEEMHVGEQPQGDGWEQDPDTLDTWFSSGLWTFSTMLNPTSTTTDLASWCADSPDLKKFHPTDVIETGYDILPFWVARMILMTTYALGEVPFRTVYLHGLVRDDQGRKMSKSLGNAMDPLDLIAQYGADALRLSLVIGTAPGNDMRLSDEKVAGYRNFVNKLWNISRFILTSTNATNSTPQPETIADHWILHEFNLLKEAITTHINEYRYSIAGELLYEFTWKKLADWYLEVAKVEGQKDAVLRSILKELLVLWHPFTPFVTEHIWSFLDEDKPLIIARWPGSSAAVDANLAAQFAVLQDVITAARDLKQEAKTTTVIDMFVTGDKHQDTIATHKAIIERLAKVTLTTNAEAPNDNTPKRALAGITVYTKAAAAAASPEERANLEQYIQSLKSRLANEEFRAKAPAAILAKEEAKLKDAEEKLKQL